MQHQYVDDTVGRFDLADSDNLRPENFEVSDVCAAGSLWVEVSILESRFTRNDRD